ncbi:hypothetical protein FE257_010902 [Aspergillus nanangensis]|uniref:Uncharacterized protein n=1 Tax=Aspergillus nanangensis TaxID=2582783 RepID=A0AAD4GYB5_ASPNN|nr:hypothetical protein FE257_010902 [Aspergillus nanangensis]
MAFFSFLCGCWTRPNTPLPQNPNPDFQPHRHQDGPPTTSVTNGLNIDDDGYSHVTPLPAYTPRPQSINEKTLEAHMRDPPISSTDAQFRDEKSRFIFDDSYSNNDTHTPRSQRPEDLTSDVSSAISFPSSYGNTSTATRETPPPPYSPRAWSPVPSIRRMSISSAGFPPMTQIVQPRPVFQRLDRCSARRSLHEESPPLGPESRRFSWESR